MKIIWITAIALVCVSCSTYESRMKDPAYAAMIARDVADPDRPDYVDQMAIIDATHAPPCGICDPITRKSPDGTYTLPPQNR
jgi:hypothetical protein